MRRDLRTHLVRVEEAGRAGLLAYFGCDLTGAGATAPAGRQAQRPGLGYWPL
ncbi:hypothetical protein [Dactylosporangium sp. NPDC005555]|uniref:hypothetical protein n=1 Tax=Dactylosporangium sp. NPDC005555 TaxID=3154889 RepID=UPI0033B66D37